MLREVAGISSVRKLYLQLQYRCNFNCQHCFHGERLKWQDAFSFDEASSAIQLFRNEYNLESVTLLGGEPFLYRDLGEVLAFAKQSGIYTEICTNGYKIEPMLGRLAKHIDNLRVSLEGLEQTNDSIRHPGSFSAGIATLTYAKKLGIRISTTLTVNAKNVDEVAVLAGILDSLGVRELKLHCLRNLGNAQQNPALLINDPAVYGKMHDSLMSASKNLSMKILFDEDLDPSCRLPKNSQSNSKELERIEIQPSGEIYVSCKAVGAKNNAFVYDKKTRSILYQPKEKDEMRSGIPQVKYSNF